MPCASNAARSREPHEEFLWDTGFHWGEWCEPDLDDMDHFANFARHDFGIIATAYFAHSAATLAAIARVLERPEDADRYDVLARNVREAWQTEFVTGDGSLRSTRQADYVRALAFDLIPNDLRAAPPAGSSSSSVRPAPTSIPGSSPRRTCCRCSPTRAISISPTSCCFQDTPPSWLTMIDRGATTIWEQWEGIDADGVAHASLNHYSKGAVDLVPPPATSRASSCSTTARAIAASASRRVRAAGSRGRSAAHESPYGRIESSWTTDAAGTTLTVKVPPNTEAEVVLPDGRAVTVRPGHATFHSR